jgi:hypothetical protein
MALHLEGQTHQRSMSGVFQRERERERKKLFLVPSSHEGWDLRV